MSLELKQKQSADSSLDLHSKSYLIVSAKNSEDGGNKMFKDTAINRLRTVDSEHEVSWSRDEIQEMQMRKPQVQIETLKKIT